MVQTTQVPVTLTICDNLPPVRGLIDLVLALPMNLLPRSRWDDWDLPIANVTLASSLITLFAVHSRCR